MNRSPLRCTLIIMPLLVAGCSSVPASVKLYAAELPLRADGQYALLSDDSVKKQLVMKDSELKCKIDIEEGTAEDKSAACQCTKSVGDWLVDCKAWLGAHTPAAPAPSTPTPPPTPAAPGTPP